MSDRVERTLSRTSLAAALVAVAAMLAPWAGSGRVDRSIFGTLSSASALDLLSMWQKVVVSTALILVVVAVSAAVVATAWGRSLLASVALVGTGPILLVAAAVVGSSPLALQWGGYVSGGAGTVASTCATIVVAAHLPRRTHRT